MKLVEFTTTPVPEVCYTNSASTSESFYGYDFGTPPVPVAPEKKNTQKMEVELCLCSKALWS